MQGPSVPRSHRRFKARQVFAALAAVLLSGCAKSTSGDVDLLTPSSTALISIGIIGLLFALTCFISFVVLRKISQIAQAEREEEVQENSRWRSFRRDLGTVFGPPWRLGGNLLTKAYISFGSALLLPYPIYRWGPDTVHRLLSGEHTQDAVFLSQWMVPVFAMITAALGIGMGSWMLLLRRGSRGCVTLEQAADQFGIDVDQLQTKVTAENVRVRFIVDEKPVYSQSDLSQAGLLVRASHPPSAADELVRPAGPSSNNEETLLRAVVSGHQ